MSVASRLASRFHAIAILPSLKRAESIVKRFLGSVLCVSATTTTTTSSVDQPTMSLCMERKESLPVKQEQQQQQKQRQRPTGPSTATATTTTTTAVASIAANSLPASVLASDARSVARIAHPSNAFIKTYGKTIRHFKRQ